MTDIAKTCKWPDCDRVVGDAPGMSATIDDLRARVAKLESMTALEAAMRRAYPETYSIEPETA